MHKHPRTSKRKILALRFFIYGVMTLATIVISAVCILLVMGYQFNFSKRTLEQGGLLQLRSFPSNATINVDGDRLSFTTPGKYNVEAGTHTVGMSLEGYRPWSKTVKVDPGQLLWLNYTRLVPQSITTTGLREFKRLEAVLPAPDRESLALLPDVNKPQLILANTSDSRNVSFANFQIPTDSFQTSAEAKHSFALHEWDFGSRYLLVEHRSGGKTEYLRVDTEDPDRTVNVSRLFSIDISQIHFSGSSGNVFYVLSDGSIRKLDVGTKTATAPLVRDAVSFSLYGDEVIAYVTKTKTAYTAGLLKGDQDVTVAQYNTDKPIKVQVTEYFNQTYVVVTRDRMVTLYRNPQPAPVDAEMVVHEMTSPQPVSWLDFSSQGRFLVVGNGDHFMTYDLETKDQYQGTLPKARNGNKPFLWLDDFYFVTIGGSDLRIAEFDGANQQFITDMEPGYRASLSADGEMLYSVTRQDDGEYVLQASQMVIE